MLTLVSYFLCKGGGEVSGRTRISTCPGAWSVPKSTDSKSSEQFWTQRFPTGVSEGSRTRFRFRNGASEISGLARSPGNSICCVHGRARVPGGPTEQGLCLAQPRQVRRLKSDDVATFRRLRRSAFWRGRWCLIVLSLRTGRPCFVGSPGTHATGVPSGQ
eukprot:gene12097-biopygen3406